MSDTDACHYSDVAHAPIRGRAEACRAGRRAAALVLAGLAIVAEPAPAQPVRPSPDGASGAARTAEVTLTLLDQGRFAGKVVAFDDNAIVVFDGQAPYVFAWDELDGVSAYQTRLALMRSARSGGALTAEEHLALGAYALRRGQEVLAAGEFRQAKELQDRVRAVIDEHKAAVAARPKLLATPPSAAPRASDAPAAMGTASLLEGLPSASMGDHRIVPTPPDQAARIVDLLKQFYSPRLADAVSDRMSLDETEHFLIWSDLPPGWRRSLSDAAEGMYAALCEQFGFDPRENIFLGKCPIFCFAAKEEFLQFARAFDGYEKTDLAGYTRSVEERGYVHVALFLNGRTPEHWDRFLCTLVHESSHAFLHRFHASTLIPHWVNEGYADYVTERVLKSRCYTGECSALLARQFARYDWPMRNLLRGTGPILVHQYPVAQSVVGFLIEKDPAAFRRFIILLKQGQDTESALRESFHWSLDELEANWRKANIGATEEGGGTAAETPR